MLTPAKREGYLRRLGGGSLTLSLLLHGALGLIAFFLIRFAVELPTQHPIDFIPIGGNSGHQQNQVAKIKRNSVTHTATSRIMTVCPTAITLPDVPMMSFNTDISSFVMLGGGGLHGGASGRTNGHASSSDSCMDAPIAPKKIPGFVAMFGKQLKSRKLAVVLDVSRSMHPFIPTVVKEANKISGGCPIMMFYGCGLQETKDRSIARKRSDSAKGKDFENFWRITFSPAEQLVTKQAALPTAEVFDVFNDRKETYFYEKVGNYAWLALTAREIRGADAIYWFADFQDPVDQAELESLAKTLIQRKQKLYVHASGSNPRSLAMVEEFVVKPTGGEVLTIDIKASR